jgi:hypothetical protein
MTHDVIVLPLKRAGVRDTTSIPFFSNASGAPCSAPDSRALERGVDAVAMAVALRYLTDRARRRTSLVGSFATAAALPALP